MTRAREGFTLVEVLVSLAVFALIAAAGATVLATSIDNRFAVKSSTDRLAALQRMRGLMRADLGQAVGRRVRGPTGRPLPQAMVGPTGSGGPILVLTRAGWANPSGDARPSLQRVEYRIEGEVLERRVSTHLDGSEVGPPQVLYRGVSNPLVEFIRDGEAAPAFISTPERPLPDAVRITLDLRGYGRVEQDFLVGGAT